MKRISCLSTSDARKSPERCMIGPASKGVKRGDGAQEREVFDGVSSPSSRRGGLGTGEGKKNIGTDNLKGVTGRGGEANWGQ